MGFEQVCGFLFRVSLGVWGVAYFAAFLFDLVVWGSYFGGSPGFLFCLDLVFGVDLCRVLVSSDLWFP